MADDVGSDASFCPYCGQEKPHAEFTDEHVLPAALGGNLTPTNPFLLRACRRCNTACGRHVDGPFIRSWMVSNNRASHARAYLDLAMDPVIPVTALGPVPSLSWEGNDCELWLGPTGDVVYHFHEPYPRPEENASIVGRPINARSEEIDPGFVILMIQASNPAWHRCIIRSVLEQFRDTTVYLGNAANIPPGAPPRLKLVPAELEPLRGELRRYNGQNHSARIAVNLEGGDRFLGKLALGFGALFLGEPFISSTTAARLRTFLWGRTAELRSDAEIRGAGFFEPIHKEAIDVMGWKPGHVFIMMPVGHALGLNCFFYGAQAATIEITPAPAHWREHIPNEGSVYVVSPSRQQFSGPHVVSEFVAAKLGNAQTDGARALSEFMERCSRETTLPPYHLDGTGGIMLIAERFEAFIYEEGEKRVLGAFPSQEAAQSAFDEAALDYTARRAPS